MTTICFLVSGGGGNLKFLHQCVRDGILRDVELRVVADRECGALDFARSRPEIGSALITYSRHDNRQLKAQLASEPDLVVTNWHKIIDAEVVRDHESRMINLHYSLLPAFAGTIGDRPVREAMASGGRFTGTTCHYVSEDVDAGQIISQSVVPIDGDLAQVMPSVFRSGCLCLLNSILQLQPQVLNLRTPSFTPSDHRPPLRVDPSVFDEAFWEQVQAS